MIDAMPHMPDLSTDQAGSGEKSSRIGLAGLAGLVRGLDLLSGGRSGGIREVRALLAMVFPAVLGHEYSVGGSCGLRCLGLGLGIFAERRLIGIAGWVGSPPDTSPERFGSLGVVREDILVEGHPRRAVAGVSLADQFEVHHGLVWLAVKEPDEFIGCVAIPEWVVKDGDLFVEDESGEGIDCDAGVDGICAVER